MAAIVRHVCINMLRRNASHPMSGPDLETIEEAVPPDDFTSSISPLPEAARSGAVQGDPDGFPLWLVACRVQRGMREELEYRSAVGSWLRR
jgi:hypothetical protein